jgi:hypothetical protein
MNAARLKYAIVFVGLLTPLSAHAGIGDPSPDATAPERAIAQAPAVVDTNPVGSIRARPATHPQRHVLKKPKSPPDP